MASTHALRFRPLLSTARPTPPRAVSAARRGSTPAFVVVRCSSARAPSAAQALKFAADWEAARVDKEQGSVLTLPVLRSNRGRLILKYNSLQGFVPYPLLSPTHWCKDPKRPIQDVTKDLVGTSISVKFGVDA